MKIESFQSGDLCCAQSLRALKRSMVINMTGMFAVSRAGHDKGQMYVVIREDDDFAYLADGKIRKLENPKKKKKKHLQIVKTDTDKVLQEKIVNGQIIYNEEIKRAVKLRTGGCDVKG